MFLKEMIQSAKPQVSQSRESSNLICVIKSQLERSRDVTKQRGKF